MKHILTISVEDYFHADVFRGTVSVKRWEGIESRLRRNIEAILEMFARHDVRATFFVLGWTAEREPELVRRITEAGHEVASRGYWPRGARGMVPAEFREDLRRTKGVLEEAGSNRILGFRSSNWIHPDETWILDVLAEEGYLYDSSINPVLRRFAHDPRRFVVHRHRHSAGTLALWEFPISTTSVLGVRVAISGGNYIRQLPHTFLRRAVDRWARTKEHPLIFYFMPWELDRTQPQIGAISALKRVRHYRNLDKTRWVLEEYFGRYSFESIADNLGVEHTAPVEAVPRPIGVGPTPALNGAALPVTVVVPLYNEQVNVVHLHRTLMGLRRSLASKYRIHLILVDDGSRDDTWAEIQARFAGLPDFQALRHERNRGVAGAILTGIRSAPTEIVGTIDCDCSYDPMILEQMIPKIESADLVTASPYHPEGGTFNVPAWRLFLSKSLSRLYSFALGERLYTYTSCCRVLRRSLVDGLDLQHEGFLGVAELLIRARLKGARIVEHPATLEARLFGESKMKTARTIRGHLRLLTTLFRGRLAGGRPEPGRR